jgi:Zn-dependent protease
VSAEPPSAPEDPSPPRRDDDQPPFDPEAYPPPYPPNAYPPPGYPAPQGPGGYPPGYPGNGQPPQGPGGTRQHAWRTPFGTSPPPPGGPQGQQRRPGGQRSLIWLVLAVLVAVFLVRSHRLNSDQVILFCTLIPSVILHEVAHGVVALWFGDDTAKRAGRITLNPIRHVTLFGTIIVPIITVISGLGAFGWAKPVPVNVRNLRHPRNEGVLVSLAGPFTNVVLAAICGAAFYLAFAVGSNGPVATSLGARILFYAGFINVWVACFNMIPIPPLDGSAIIERLLPASWWPGYLRIRPYGMFVIFGALVLMSFSRTSPLQTVVTHLITWWAHVVHAT